MPPNLNHPFMKHLHTIVLVLLNVIFCGALLWFFSRFSYLRPYAGSRIREVISGVLLLTTLYANYYILYPKLHRGHIIAYWTSMTALTLVTAAAELTIAYKYIAQCSTYVINEVGFYNYFFTLLLLIFGRNIAFSFFPYMLKERSLLQQFLETEVKIVYQYARLIDACDIHNNCHHVSIENIYYCIKNGNYSRIYTTEGPYFTRYCSLKYLYQLLGNKEFIRISHSTIVPYTFIASCDEKKVILKKTPWMENPISFPLDSKRNHQIAEIINQYLKDNKALDESELNKRYPSIPPQNKLDAVFNYIQSHHDCRSTEITSNMPFSLSTVERCLSELSKQGLIEYAGSKKTGGYRVVKENP